MKNFYYAFTQKGTLEVWFTAPDNKPELQTQITPVLNLPGEMQTHDNGKFPIEQNLFAGGVALVIEYRQYYCSKYGNN